MFFLIILLIFSPHAVLAQEPTPVDQFTQYKNDYTYQYNLYQQDYLKYLEKKDVYTKYGSVSTEADKLNTAKTAINTRNLALRSYLQALQVYLDKYQTYDQINTDRLQIEIQNWINWFEEQISIVPNINNSSDLTKWVEDFKTKYVDIQQTIYSALVYNQINQKKFTQNLLTILTETIKQDPNIKPENQLWISNLTVRTDLIDTNLKEAAQLTVKKPYQNKFSNFYPEARNLISSANNYLRDTLNDLKIIIIKSFSNGN